MVESDSSFTFGRDECTRIDGGAFYCQERNYDDVPPDSLAALPDRDGDLEIYVTRNGEQTKVTDNQYDDSAPFFDPHSETIVWQRLLGDYFQIVSFDIDSSEETVLTNGKTNNMEPARHGDFTVWQRWLDDNWEIILYDGTRELRVTNSVNHDIAPSIRGSLIIWNTQLPNGEHELQTFDFKTNTRDVIKDDEGVAVGNPRMVVIYEALYGNGDTVTKGYDLVSGEVIPLHSLPKPLPEDLPDADKTEGETRALVQSKPSVKEEVMETVLTTTEDPEADTLTLDLRPASSTETMIVENADEDFTLDIASSSQSAELDIADEATTTEASSHAAVN
jgi:hypothetical protein